MSTGTEYEQAIAADLLSEPTIKAIWIAAFGSAVASEAMKAPQRPDDRTAGMYAAMEAVVHFAFGKSYAIRDRLALAGALYRVLYEHSNAGIKRAESRS